MRAPNGRGSTAALVALLFVASGCGRAPAERDAQAGGATSESASTHAANARHASIRSTGKGECADGVDNDHDGLTDWFSDLGCTAADDATEGGTPSGSLERGFTVFEPARDTRVIYVSSAVGNDAFDGRAPYSDGKSGPKRSLAAGLAELRDGHPDWLLLRRGDRFREGFALQVSGRSATEPLVIASYGESLEQPLVLGSIDGKDVSFVAVLDLHLHRTEFEQSMIGFSLSSHVLIEGLLMDGGSDCVTAAGTGPVYDWRVRRNVCVRPLNNGAFFEWVHGLLLEDNVVYRPGTKSANHAFYIARKGNEDVVTRGNLILMDKPKGDGIMQRPGGLSEGNVVVAADWQGINFGACNDDASRTCYPPVPVKIRGNLLLDGKTLGGGISVGCEWVLPGAEVVDNIVAHAGPDSFPAAGTACRDMLFRGNILYDAKMSLWRGENIQWLDNYFYGTRPSPLVVVSEPAALRSVVARQNHYFSKAERNQWFDLPGPGDFRLWQQATHETGSDVAITFADPERSLAKYNASLGGPPDREAFFLEAITQKRLRYRKEYGAPAVIAYFREGFAVRPPSAKGTP